MMGDAEAAARAAVASVWKRECARIVAVVARMTRDVALAEECAQDALLAALQHWPRDGLPDNPAAWLTTAAKHRALDHLRHHQLREGKHAELGADLQALQAAVVPDFSDTLDARRADDLGDDLLRLMVTACHPVLPFESQVALTLRLLGGLSTPEIARAFLVPEPTVAQRIVRAKRLLGQAQVPFELPPPGPARDQRLAAVMAVLYLVFNEGYAASAGDDALRPALCDEALRLARVLAARSHAAEPQGLLALLALQASRQPARTDAAGEPLRLDEQDRGRWLQPLIAEGLAALDRAADRAEALGQPLGPYALQAAIAACHARASSAEATDWPSIVALYDALLARQPSPVVALNRAMAVAMAEGPAAGLALLQPLAGDARLARYPWLAAGRAELLQRLGRGREAASAYEQAADLSDNRREQAQWRARAALARRG